MNIGNSLQAVKSVVTTRGGRSLLRVQKQSPHILFVVGVVGVVGTAVYASKATLKLQTKLETQEPAETKAEKVKLARDILWIYTPAITCGVVTVGALTGSHVILNRRYVGVMAAYAGLDKTFADYRDRVRELIGEEKENDVHKGLSEVTLLDEKGEKQTIIVRDPDGFSQYAKLFARDTTLEWEKEAEYRFIFLRAQQQWANDYLRSHGHLFLNDVYRVLGFEDTSAGSVVGWVYNNPKGVGDNYVDFGIFTDRSRERLHEFMETKDGAIWLDFNVDGVVWNLIDDKKKD